MCSCFWNVSGLLFLWERIIRYTKMSSPDFKEVKAQGHKTKLLPQYLCHLPTTTGGKWWCGGIVTWRKPPNFMWGLVIICVGYSTLNGLWSNFATLFSAASKIRPKHVNTTVLPHAVTWDPLQSYDSGEYLLRVLEEVTLVLEAWLKSEVISCSVKILPPGLG